MQQTLLKPTVHEFLEPLAKGETQECMCNLEGCHTILTVLDTEENCLEIYQSSAHSMSGVIARIVLPDNLKLCRVVGREEF